MKRIINFASFTCRIYINNNNMKRFLIILAFAAAAVAISCAEVYAATPKNVKYVFTEASDLNLIGKILDNTPNPYHRVDTKASHPEKTSRCDVLQV